MAYVITDTCTKDELCIEACPWIASIRKGRTGFADVPHLYVNPATASIAARAFRSADQFIYTLKICRRNWRVSRKTTRPTTTEPSRAGHARSLRSPVITLDHRPRGSFAASSRPAQITGQLRRWRQAKRQKSAGVMAPACSPSKFRRASAVRLRHRHMAVAAGHTPEKTEHYFDFRALEPLGAGDPWSECVIAAARPHRRVPAHSPRP